MFSLSANTQAPVPERTFWTVCWDKSGLPILPSDTPPHKHRDKTCTNPVEPDYNRPYLRVYIADSVVSNGNLTDTVGAMYWVNDQLGFELFQLGTIFEFDIHVMNDRRISTLLGIGHPLKLGNRLVGQATLLGKVHKMVIAHELLHAVGLAHDVSDRTSIMYPYYIADAQPVLKAADKAAILEKYGRRNR